MLDLTKYPIKKGILTFSLPIIFSLIMRQLYLVVDTIIVGKFLGVDELSAVGNASSIIAVFIVISGGIEMGCEVVFAKYIGEKKYETIVKSMKGILLFVGCISILLTGLVVVLEEPIFRLINIPEELWQLTSIYLTIYSFGLLFIFIYDITKAILMAMGDSKSAFIIVLITSVLNIGLDLLFICSFNMGIEGAAIATVLSQIVGMIVVLQLVQKRVKQLLYKKEKFIYPTAQVKEILGISVPTMFQQAVLSLAALILQGLINPFGAEIISGYVAVNKIIMLLMMVTIGFCQTLSIFTAQNIGANKINRVKEGHGFCIHVVLIYAVVVILLNVTVGEKMMALFVDADQYPAAIDFGVRYLLCSSVMYIFYGMKNINESFLRGYAKMKAFLLSNLTDLIVRVAMTALLLSSFGLDSFWIATTIGTITAYLISSYILGKGDWFSVPLVSNGA